MKVFISAGHGGSDPGAVGNGLLEKDCNLFIALAFGAELEKAGVNVKYSRTKDENDPVTQEVIEANHFQADFAISFHNNAGGGIGSESYYYPGDMTGEALAGIFEAVTISMGAKSRGAKTTNKLYFIRNTAMTAVLVESAFIDSKDYVRIDSYEKCNELGKKYAKAFLSWANIKPVEENKPGEFKTFQIKAKNRKLYVFRNHTRDSEITYVIEDKRRYTIIEEYNEVRELESWFKLKSGIGWVNSDDVVIIE